MIASPGQPGDQVRLLTDLFDIPATGRRLDPAAPLAGGAVLPLAEELRPVPGALVRGAVGDPAAVLRGLIAMLLMYLRTGLRPSKYALNLLGMVVSGAATWEEVRPILAKRAASARWSGRGWRGSVPKKRTERLDRPACCAAETRPPPHAPREPTQRTTERRTHDGHPRLRKRNPDRARDGKIPDSIGLVHQCHPNDPVTLQSSRSSTLRREGNGKWSQSEWGGNERGGPSPAQ